MREVTAGARIGVHTIAFGEFAKDGTVKSRKSGPLSPDETAKIKAANAYLAQYITAMRIERGLFDAAAAIAHERVRYISRDEIASFGIDKREFHESKWTVDEGPPGPLVVVKFMTERKSDDQKAFSDDED